MKKKRRMVRREREGKERMERAKREEEGEEKREGETQYRKN